MADDAQSRELTSLRSLRDHLQALLATVIEHPQADGSVVEAAEVALLEHEREFGVSDPS